MTEKEYWISNFEEKFQTIRGKRIALYGSGVNAAEILKRFPGYDFVCVVDDNAVGRLLDGYFVVNFAQMLEMDIECLIIAARTVSAEVVYNRISLECKAHGIRVFNLYGCDMHKLHRDIVEMTSRYAKMDEKKLENKISEHDVIAYDVDNTLFSVCRTNKFDFYQKVEHQLLTKGIKLDYFAEKFLKIKDIHPDWSYCYIVENVIKNDNMDVAVLSDIWDITLHVMKEDFVPRKAVLDSLKYALSLGKTVCLIEDMAEYRIKGELWLKLLAEYGVSGIDTIFCSSEYFEDKYQGLIREITARYPNKTWLYVGDEIEADILVPKLYGIESFLTMSPKDLYKALETLKPDMLVNKYVRESYETYLMEVYNDEYLINKVCEKQKEKRVLLKDLERKISFCQNIEGDVYDNTMIYTPVLLDDITIVPDMEKYEKLQFPTFEKPQVSIIIPVYNEFGYTYNCLKSILQHSENVSYEIIVADDCSTDQTSTLESVVSGITVHHNKENLKFLLNCNQAAKMARGEYIVFLNNDTQVQPNWLQPMVDLLKENKNIGMAGAKLVYPNGCLQEAGGILWKDGSAWNYGHMKNPTDPEYCYVKEADYISGAAIMIRASLWNEIGGFDESFAPAYYEDTDLAFEVRKHGYKVFLQPASVVVHFEGISNGTDTSKGLKNYQVVNQKKFYEKWKDVLETENFENGTNVYLAKDRGQTRKQILVVDHYVPNFDKDAGGRCTYMYMKAFLKLGMKVTFIGDNFAKPEPYTTILNQLGIEVLYGDYYCMHWKEWLKDNLKYFDFIYLQRPHISIKYMDLVKEYGRGKIFYFAHDLHHVRMYRDYLVSGNEDALKESEYWKKIEMELFEKTDVGHVVGSYEQEVMQKAFPDKPIRNIPLYIYDDEPDRIEKDFSKRTDILFVGGFKHAPNIDAVLWFAKEIFPQLLQKYPELVWHIVGSSAPEEIKALASEHIVLEGFVTDEELGELYRKCRLVVVPLRYGAGVKGKIVESAYYQIPVVTTAIGGEGLDAGVGSFVMEDDADKMAQLIERLYTDYDELRKMSDAGETMIQKYFTSNAAEKVLLEDMNL